MYAFDNISCVVVKPQSSNSFYLYSTFNHSHCHRAVSQNSGYRFSKPEVTALRKTSLKLHEEEPLRGSRHKSELILLWPQTLVHNYFANCMINLLRSIIFSLTQWGQMKLWWKAEMLAVEIPRCRLGLLWEVKNWSTRLNTCRHAVWATSLRNEQKNPPQCQMWLTTFLNPLQKWQVTCGSNRWLGKYS